MSTGRFRPGFVKVRAPESPRGRSDKSQERFAARRSVKQGYPWNGRFETVEQIKEYFSGEEIVCLECGRLFRCVSIAHLSRIHGTTVDKYREKFGLPWSRGLTSDASRNAYSKSVKTRLDNPEELEKLLTRAAEARKLNKVPHRQASRAIIDSRIERITGKQVGALFGPEHAEEILRRVASGRTLRDVLRDADMPKPSWWHQLGRENPSYKMRLREIMDALPFATQAKAEMLGERFAREVSALLSEGKSYKEIAAKVGVHWQTVGRFVRSQNGLSQ